MDNFLIYKKYAGKVVFDAEDLILYGEVVGLKDSLNFTGYSVEEIVQSFHNCIDDYIACCEYFRKEPEVPNYDKYPKLKREIMFLYT